MQFKILIFNKLIGNVVVNKIKEISFLYYKKLNVNLFIIFHDSFNHLKHLKHE